MPLSERAIRDLACIFAKFCRDFEAALIDCMARTIPFTAIALSAKGRALEACAQRCAVLLWSPSYFVASCGGAPLSIVAD
jgi:putative transposase